MCQRGKKDNNVTEQGKIQRTGYEGQLDCGRWSRAYKCSRFVKIINVSKAIAHLAVVVYNN